MGLLQLVWRTYIFILIGSALVWHGDYIDGQWVQFTYDTGSILDEFYWYDSNWFWLVIGFTIAVLRGTVEEAENNVGLLRRWVRAKENR